jgi:hypothetical protein
MEIIVALGFLCVVAAIIYIPRRKDKEEIPPVTTSGTPRSEPRRMKRE